MFQYGLIGNVIYYGGFCGVFGYLGYELFQIGNQTVNIPEEYAKEILDPKHYKDLVQDGKQLAKDKKIDYEQEAKKMAMDKDYKFELPQELKQKQQQQKKQQQKVSNLEADI